MRSIKPYASIMALSLNSFRSASDRTGSIRFLHGCLPPVPFPFRVVSGKGEDAMPTYRAYLIDGDDRVTSYKPVDAETDAEALRAARRFVDGCDVEVWHLDRKIGVLERDKK